MQEAPLMPKATAVWLVENTALSFDQVAEFCKLHPLEVKAIADGDAAQGIKGLDPIQTGQLTREEIDKGVAEPDPAVWGGLDAIAGADRSFSPQDFLAGARGAYDMVVHAFAAGDSDALKSLMSPEAFANFESAVHARADAGHTTSTTVVSIDKASIVGAQLVGATAQLSVRFSAKLASVTRDAQGEVVDGSPDNVVEHIDLWTFARDVRSRDPNWQLTATESER